MKLDAVNEQIPEPQAPGAAPQDLHVLDLLIVLSRRRKFICIFTLGAALLAAIVVFLIPSQYTAETLVLPPSQGSGMSSSLMNQLSGSPSLASAAGSTLGIKNSGEMYVSLLRSRTVEDAVIQRFGLMARYREKQMTDARTAFEKHTTAALGTKDGLIRITVRDHDPQLAAQIANSYVEELRKQSADLAISEASQRRIFFQQQLLEANGNLATAEEALKRTQQTTGILQIDSQARSLIDSAAALRAQVSAKEVELQAMRAYATEDNPDVIQAKDQLAALQNQLGRLSGTGDDPDSGLIVPKGRVPEAGMEYLRKVRDVKYYETAEQLIAKQLEMAKLDEARQGATIQVADLAVPPDKRSFPKRLPTILVAVLIGFVIACVWSVFGEEFRRMQTNPADRARIEALRASFGISN